MASYLRECDIFIDASLHEGYGLIPLEALSLGCAVVASDSGGNSAFLKDGINGILVKEVNKPDAYCAAVRALLDDRELLTRIKTEALATGKGLDQNACFKKYLGFLAAFNSSSVTAMDEFAPLKYVDEENREKSSSVSRKNSAVIGE